MTILHFFETDPENEYRFSSSAIERALGLARNYTDSPTVLEGVRRLLAPADDVPVATLAAHAEFFRTDPNAGFRLDRLLLDLERNFAFHLELLRLAPVAREALRVMNLRSPLSMNPAANDFVRRMESPSWIYMVLTGDDLIDPADLIVHPEDQMDAVFLGGLGEEFTIYRGGRGLSLEEAEDHPFWTTDRMVAEFAARFSSGSGAPRVFAGTARLRELAAAFAPGSQVVVYPRDVREVSLST